MFPRAKHWRGGRVHPQFMQRVNTCEGEALGANGAGLLNFGVKAFVFNAGRVCEKKVADGFPCLPPGVTFRGAYEKNCLLELGFLYESFFCLGVSCLGA